MKRRKQQHPAMIDSLIYPVAQQDQVTTAPVDVKTRPISSDGLIYVQVQMPNANFSYAFKVRAIMGNLSAEVRTQAGMAALVLRGLRLELGNTVEQL